MLSTRLRALTSTSRTSRYLVKPRALQICMDQFSETVTGQYSPSVRPCTRTQCTAASDAEHQKQWVDAATLMVVAKDDSQSQNSVFDYRMLFLERQGGGNVFGGTSVFPGGVIDDADFSPEWIQLYRALGIETLDSFGWEHLKNKPRAGPIAAPRAKHLLPNDVAFRLCAIRETFEESGILIASSHDDVKQSMKKASAKTFAPSSCYTDLEKSKFLEWRQRIYNDANQFLVMCQELDIFPNLWSLFELSNTLTPRAAPRRYDTVFYLSTLDSVPAVTIDEREMANDQWLNPAEGMQHHFNGDINLFPPQLLECARFINFPRLKDVQNYVTKRMDEGMDMSMPVGFYLKDCLLNTYPGDDCYPENVSLASITKIPKLEETEEENLKRCQKLHRITFYGSGRSLKFDCNITLPHNEHPPQNFNSRDWVDQSTA